MSVVETAITSLFRLGQTTNEKEEWENNPVKELYYVDQTERILTIFQRTAQSNTKATLVLMAASIIAFEPIASYVVGTQKCPFDENMIVFPVISLVSGAFFLISIGASGILSVCISQRALRRKTAENQLDLENNVQTIHRTQPQYYWDINNKKDKENSKIEKDSPHKISKENGDIIIKKPSCCERSSIIAAQVCTVLSKVTSSLTVIGLTALQLHQKRFEICNLSNGIIPSSLSFLSLGIFSATIYCVGSVFSATVDYLKASRINEAVSRKMQ